MIRADTNLIADDLWKVVKLAITTNTAAYDCEGVIVARRLKIPLVTANKVLLKVFPETAISIPQFASGS